MSDSGGTGKSIDDPVYCDGHFPSYAAVKKHFGLRDIETARSKRLGVGGIDSEGLPIDVYCHGGKRFFVSVYGSAAAKKEHLDRLEYNKGRLQALMAEGKTLEEAADLVAKEWGLGGFRAGKMRDGIIAGPVDAQAEDKRTS